MLSGLPLIYRITSYIVHKNDTNNLHNYKIIQENDIILIKIYMLCELVERYNNGLRIILIFKYYLDINLEFKN